MGVFFFFGGGGGVFFFFFFFSLKLTQVHAGYMRRIWNESGDLRFQGKKKLVHSINHFPAPLVVAQRF